MASKLFLESLTVLRDFMADREEGDMLVGCGHINVIFPKEDVIVISHIYGGY